MNGKKTDRRVLRTRRALREALLSLILEQGYESVTIEEITDRADVGRTTFYLHYRDKEELLLECINGAVDDLVEEVSSIPVSVSPYEGLKHVENMNLLEARIKHFYFHV